MTWQDPPQPPAPPSPPDPSLPPLPPLPPISVDAPPGSQPLVIIPGRDGNVERISLRGKEIIVEFKGGGERTVQIDDIVPSGAVDIVQAFAAMLLMLVVGFPISRAIARWIDRRTAQPHIPRDVMQRMQRLEETLDSVALDIERIGEGQRFTARVLADAQRDAVPVARHASI